MDKQNEYTMLALDRLEERFRENESKRIGRGKDYRLMEGQAYATLALAEAMTKLANNLPTTS